MFLIKDKYHKEHINKCIIEALYCQEKILDKFNVYILLIQEDQRLFHKNVNLCKKN